MFYIIEDVLINTKEVKYIEIDKIRSEIIQDIELINLRVEFRNNSHASIAYDTEEEAREELYKMAEKLNKPF